MGNIKLTGDSMKKDKNIPLCSTCAIRRVDKEEGFRFFQNTGYAETKPCQDCRWPAHYTGRSKTK